LNIRFDIKIFFFSLLAFLSSYAFVSSIDSFKLQEKELKKIPHFYLNGDEIISQKGESILLDDNYSFALVNLSIIGKEPLDLMINYYEIQEVLLLKNLHITELEYKKFGQIKIQTASNEFIKFQDFQLSDQLITLKLFFQSKESKKLLKNFKTIDLRHKNKLAIGYY
tara:strand:+ start:770 stop:1270 length:501 start_codon:yes stop_codon:yes gene_type:complete